MKQWHFINPNDAPCSPGCYAVYIAERLVYIGCAANLRARLMSHRLCRRRREPAPWQPRAMGFEGLAGVTVKVAESRRYGDWAMREIRLIRRLKPEMNVIGTGRRKRNT